MQGERRWCSCVKQWSVGATRRETVGRSEGPNQHEMLDLATAFAPTGACSRRRADGQTRTDKSAAQLEKRNASRGTWNLASRALRRSQGQGASRGAVRYGVRSTAHEGVDCRGASGTRHARPDADRAEYMHTPRRLRRGASAARYVSRV